MKYDFTTKVNRRDQGSEKWNEMYKKKPDVSDDVVPMSVADMELKNPPEIIEGLKNYLNDVILGYTMPNEAYYEAVINWMKKRHNFEIEKEWIVNTPGVVPAFFNAIRSFSKEGDGIVIMSPVYYPFFKAIESQKRNVVDCPLINEDGYYTIDFEKFDELTQNPKNKILLFCSPHNPVGRVWKKEELEKLKEIIIKNGVLLLADEIHNDLIMPGYEHIVFQNIDERLADRAITFTAPTKTFNLAGMTISNIIIKNREIREVFLRGLNNISVECMTVLGYKACEIGYTQCENWLEECISLIDTNQKIVNNFFKEKYPSIKASLIEGTYLQWIDFRALGFNKSELEDFMINKAEWFLNEGYVFGKNGEGYERLNLALPTKELEKALYRLDKALGKINID